MEFQAWLFAVVSERFSTRVFECFLRLTEWSFSIPGKNPNRGSLSICFFQTVWEGARFWKIFACVFFCFLSFFYVYFWKICVFSSICFFVYVFLNDFCGFSIVFVLFVRVFMKGFSCVFSIVSCFCICISEWKILRVCFRMFFFVFCMCISERCCGFLNVSCAFLYVYSE